MCLFVCFIVVFGFHFQILRGTKTWLPSENLEQAHRLVPRAIYEQQQAWLSTQNFLSSVLPLLSYRPAHGVSRAS